MKRDELPSGPLRLRLTPGAKLYATGDGLLAQTSRAQKVDLGSRAFEEEFVSLLRAGGDLSPLSRRYSEASVSRAIAALKDAGVVTDAVRCVVADLLPCEGHLPPPVGVELIGSPDALARGDVLGVVAHMADERIRPYLVQARALQIPALVAWIDPTSIAIGLDDGLTRPCLQCALLFDSRFRTARLSEAADAAIHAAVLSGRFCEAESGAVENLARSLLHAVLRPGAARPRAGEALTLEVRDWALSRERYPPHPSCECTGQPAEAERAPRFDNWVLARGRRFTPVLCVDPGSKTRPARTFFRRSRSPWPSTRDDFGIASATGEDATVRAFAEGVERFCMLHARPDVRRAAAAELKDPALDEALIRSVLFRPDERAAAAFRLPDYSPELPLDWSWASNTRTGARSLVPTSLIGRPSAGSTRLVDTTSNGYAAHTDRERAVELAVLEVIERDAVLRAWYLSQPLVAIEAADIPLAGHDGVDVRAFLVTQEIDLPVVLMVARLSDGGLRACAAAALDFETAWTKAVSELIASLQALDAKPRPSEIADLRDAAQRNGPVEHLRYYRDPARAEPALSALWSPSKRAERLSLLQRWPAVAPAVRLPQLIAALERAGMDAWIVDRSLPEVFGAGWHVVRALVPGTVEVSWGDAYRRLATPRITSELQKGASLNPLPHPIA